MNKFKNSATWHSIDSLGKTRFSKLNFLWIFLIPILIRATEQFEKTVTFSFRNSELTLVLDLPFSLYLLYFSSLFLAFGAVLYFIFCPSFIMRYPNFSNFIRGGGNMRVLKSEINNSQINSENPDLLDNEGNSLLGYVPAYPSLEEDKDSYSGYRQVDRQNLYYEDALKKAYVGIFKILNSSKSLVRWFIWGLYLIGFGFLFFVLGQNLVFVLRTFFSVI